MLFDPNVRLTLIPDAASYRQRFKRWLAACDILKFSDEDAVLLAPGLTMADAAALFLQGDGASAHAPRVVVITRGGEGATLYRRGHAPIEVRPPAITVVDTIGAGDTFAAGLSVGLLEQGIEHAPQLDALPDDAWHQVLRFAATAAALNCTREGANPPTRAELQTALQAVP